MRKLVVYITRVLNVKLALSFYISVYMHNQYLIFHQHKQWIQITAISHQNAYKEVFWLQFQGGACPPDPLDCAHRKLCAARELCAAHKLCAALKLNRKVPWCFLIFLGETPVRPYPEKDMIPRKRPEKDFIFNRISYYMILHPIWYYFICLNMYPACFDVRILYT